MSVLLISLQFQKTDYCSPGSNSMHPGFTP